MHINSHCYAFDDYKIDDALFDDVIDMSYVLTMKSSTRNFKEQLDKFRPTSIVRIQTNDGFKKCNKKLYKQSTTIDICDAYANVFVEALNNGYKNVLVLEDDFEFENTTLTKAEHKSIERFLKTTTYDTYNIGSPFGFIVPNASDGFQYRALLTATAHGVIYSKRYMRRYLELYEKNDIRINDFSWNRREFKNYQHYRPLVKQTFPMTDNRAMWSNTLFNYGIEKIGVDKNTDNYDTIMLVSKILSAEIVLSLIVVLLMIIVIIVCTIYKR